MIEKTSDAAPPLSRAALDPPLLLTTFLSGSAVMIVEILGTRLLGPFFGVGLFVWSALLSVTLAALAVGYLLGGIVADRRQSPVLVFRLAIVAGCLIVLISPSTRHILAFGDALGIRLGSLVSALLLFGPALVVMGMLTTAATRQAAFNVARPGRNVGIVYAVSTIGGLAGTLLAGFVLVPRFAVHNTLTVVAALLIASGVLGLVLRGRSRRAVAALVFPLFGLGAPSTRPIPGVVVLERSESLHGRLSVIQDDSQGPSLRLLRADHSFVGGHWVETREPAFGFVHLLEAVRLARPNGRNLLQIGLGIGSVPMSLAKYGIRTDVVEIDPEVIRLARKHFGYTSTGETYAEDARTLIRTLQKRYDFVIHDAFTGGSVPEHLLSVEVLRRIHALLEPGGVLALNLVGAEAGSLSPGAQAVNRTVRSVFRHVRVFRDGPPQADSPISNLIFFASSESVRFTLETTFESPRCQELLTTFEQWEVPMAADAAAPIVTDERNPLALLGLPVSEEFRTAMNQLYPPEFWLE